MRSSFGQKLLFEVSFCPDSIVTRSHSLRYHERLVYIMERFSIHGHSIVDNLGNNSPKTALAER